MSHPEKPAETEKPKLARNLPEGFEKGASIGLHPDAVREINPDFYAGQPPMEAPQMRTLDTVRSTTYYTPLFHGRIDESTLSMEGSGILIDADGNAQILSASGESHEISPDNMRGKGAAEIKEPLTTYRTIAVDPSVIPLGTWVYVDFGNEHPNTGWYRAEDTGGSIKGNHIDIFTGVGIQNYQRGKQEIPGTAQRIVWFEDGQIHTESSARREEVVARAMEERGMLASATLTDTLGIAPQESGAIHGKYLELIDSEEVKPHLEADRKKLGESSIVDIRFNPRLLKPAEGEEPAETQKKNLKAETARRIAAYTSTKDGQWYTLDYSSVGGEEHLYNIGLGDILLDPDIEEVLVDRGGELIHARRGVPQSGKYKGRQSFVDQYGSYVATYDGDRFKILSGEEMASDAYVQKLNLENKVREAGKPAFEQEYMAQKATEEEIKRYLEEDEDNPAFDIQIAEEGSVVDQITFNLDGEQMNNARIIEEEFRAAGIAPSIIAAAIINAHSESRLRNIQSNCYKNGIREESYGLFQVNIPARGGRVTAEQMLDPRQNCREILREITNKRGGRLRALAGQKASVSKLTAVFCYDIERPGKRETSQFERARKSLAFFSDGVKQRDKASTPETAVASREKGQETEQKVTFDFQTPEGLKGKTDLAGGQDAWILGSSSAYGMDNYREGNTGICGIIGANPRNFFTNFKNRVWPEVKDFKMPRQVVLMGLSVNGLPKNPSDRSIKREMDGHLRIAQFFEDRGVDVKITTLQPYEPKLASIQQFNNTLREDYPQYCMDIAPIFTTEDGQHWKTGMAARDNLHLSSDANRAVGSYIADQSGERPA